MTKAERATKVAMLLRSLYKCLYSGAKDRNPQRVPGTCEWFTSHDLFQNWRYGKTCGLLWVSADPGCGKSVLSRYLVDDILPSSSSSTTCYFFFKDDVEKQKSAVGALCCLLRQIFIQKPALLPDSLLQQYDEDGDMLLDSFRELWHILVSISSSQGDCQIVCILDALDECETEDRRLLVETLNNFYLEKGTNTNLKFLVTSRPYINIERGFYGIQTKLPVIHLRGDGQFESDMIAREIDLVVEIRIIELCEKLQLRGSEKKVMRQELKKRPNRTYLWVYLVFQVLETCADHSPTQLEEHIRSIPTTVEEVYEKILSKSPNKNKAMKLLHMVVAAKRPLKLKEMAVAMTIAREHTLYSQLDIGSEERLRIWVRDLCGLFVSIVGDNIYLLHQTAAEFLVERICDGDARSALLREDDSGSGWKWSLSPILSNLILGASCAKLLLFTDVVDTVAEHCNAGLQITPKSLRQLDKKYPLLAYSVEHWATHLGHASDDGNLPWTSLLQLCSGRGSACLLPPKQHVWFHYDYQHAKALAPLVAASALGLVAVTRHLLKLDSTDANEGDPVFKVPPLSWAVKAGQEAVVDTFIEAEKRDHRTGYRLKRFLRKRYVDLDARNEDAYARSRENHCVELKGPTTPLGWAVFYGNANIVEKLLATGRVTVTREMLFEAAMNDREDILRALLDTRQISVRCKAENGRRLLNWALKHSAVRVTKYLLDMGKFDTDMEMQPWEGELSGLALAANRGADELLRLLLGTGKADVEFSDYNFERDLFQGRTPLSLAAEAGAQECVRLLLATGNIEVNTMDQWKKTPLHYAAQRGHEGIVQQLLATGKTKVDGRSSEGRTPLSFAAEDGNEGVVQELLAMSGVDVDSEDDLGQTPLIYAVKNGHWRAMEELLGMNADANTRDKLGYTPLMLAVSRGSEHMVGQLLHIGKADANARIAWQGHSPLRIAIAHKRLDIVRVLLDTHCVITPDCWDLATLWRIQGCDWDHHDVDYFIRTLQGDRFPLGV